MTDDTKNKNKKLRCASSALLLKIQCCTIFKIADLPFLINQEEEGEIQLKLTKEIIFKLK